MPDEAILAELAARDYPFVQLAGKQARLAPGALIYDEQSRIIPPNTLPAKARALYRLDNRGEVQTIWLLTTDETAQLKDKKKSP